MKKIKIKKLFALLLAGLLAISMLAACGGDEGEGADVEEEYEEESDDVAASDETWETLKETGAVFAQYNIAARSLGITGPPELIEYSEGIDARAVEMSTMEQETATEEEALAAIADLEEWIETYSQYISDEDLVTLTAPVSDETWAQYEQMVVAIAVVLQQVQELGENMSDELYEYAKTALPYAQELVALERETSTDAQVQVAISQIDKIGSEFSAFLEAE